MRESISSTVAYTLKSTDVHVGQDLKAHSWLFEEQIVGQSKPTPPSFMWQYHIVCGFDHLHDDDDDDDLRT